MPPQQSFLAPNICGYVCRSCISKLKQKKYTSRPSWLARNVTNDNGPSKRTPPRSTKTPSSQTSAEPVIKYWEQSPLGQRREKGYEDQEMLATLESSIKNLEKQLGDTTQLEKRDAELGLMDEEGDDDVEGGIAAELSKQGEIPREILLQMDSIKSQLKRIKDDPDFLDSLSEEGKAQMRRGLFDSLADRPSSSPESLPSPSTEGSSTSPKISPRPIFPEYDGTIPRYMAATLPSIVFPKKYQRSIVMLNSSLEHCSRFLAENKLTDAAQQHTWGCYIRCREALLDTSDQVRVETWSLLWDIFEDSGPNNFNRLEHIYKLGTDMTKRANVALQPKQRILYMEAKFVHGHEKKAILEWEEAKSSLGCDGPSFDDYWQLGVRMYAQHGDGEKSLDTAAFYLSKSQRITHFRMLIPVIRGYLVMGTESAYARAWHAYEQLKSNLRSGLTMEDFDSVTTLFLDANLPDRALGVFKDMMLAGEIAKHGVVEPPLARDGRENFDLVQAVRAEFDIEKSRALAALPQQFNNKFFFGKWIKKLIGEGHLDGAKQVLDLMEQRGIRPDAKYVNGLIGAIFRGGPLKKQEMAEELAWKMINTRLRFVVKREKTYPNLERPLHVVLVENRTPNTHDPTLLPPATIETFGILIEQYRMRQKQDLVPKLLDYLQQAKIPPNTYFMNQVMMSKVIKYQGSWAWDSYSTMVNQQMVTPDFYTFTYLWDIMRKAVDPVTKHPYSNGFVTCRRLFSEMVRQREVLCQNESMPQEVYDMTILAFSVAQDFPGLAVALCALKRYFNMLPTDKTARAIALALTKFGYRDKDGVIPKRLSLRHRATKDRIIQVTKILEQFKQEHSDALLEQGIVFANLGQEEKAEQSLIILTKMLRFVHQSHCGADISASEHSKAAAASMLVVDCDPWETAASKEVE